MNERLEDMGIALPSIQEAPEVSEPRDSPLHFPSALESSQLSAILSLGLDATTAMRADQIDSGSRQALTQGIRICRPIVDQRLQLGWIATRRRHRHRRLLQGLFDERDFRRGRRGCENSQRKTLAVCHHHKLRTLAALGFADFGAPFFAGAKVPSAKISYQSSRPSSSSCSRKVRQIVIQTPVSSHSFRRRQQVLGDGYGSGKSFQRAPLRKTQRIPSKTGRLGMGLGPPLGEALGSGSRGEILSHWTSVNSDTPRRRRLIGYPPNMEFHLFGGYQSEAQLRPEVMKPPLNDP